jgi:hypothetical protein
VNNCHFCFRPITEEILAEKRRRKADNARASAAKSKAKGTAGRKLIRDDDKIKAMRDRGMTFREISSTIGMSYQTVWNSLSKLRLDQ